MVDMKSDIVDVEVIYRHHTERGICVWADESKKEDVWLALSLVEVEGEKIRGRKITLSGPQKLMEEKGLV